MLKFQDCVSHPIIPYLLNQSVRSWLLMNLIWLWNFWKNAFKCAFAYFYCNIYANWNENIIILFVGISWFNDRIKAFMFGVYDAVVGQFSTVRSLTVILYFIWFYLYINFCNIFIFRFCKPSDESKRQKQVAQILEKLIILTIEEVEMYPSIQAKIWGSIGQVPELIDMVLDNFIQRSVSSG